MKTKQIGTRKYRTCCDCGTMTKTEYNTCVLCWVNRD